MNVATIIRDQIKTLDKWAFGAWGAKEMVNTGNGLRFKSSGMVKWKGYVHVVYDEGNDLYNVVFGKIRKMEWKTVKEVKGVFVEDLVNVIDAQVG